MISRPKNYGFLGGNDHKSYYGLRGSCFMSGCTIKPECTQSA